MILKSFTVSTITTIQTLRAFITNPICCLFLFHLTTLSNNPQHLFWSTLLLYLILHGSWSHTVCNLLRSLDAINILLSKKSETQKNDTYNFGCVYDIQYRFPEWHTNGKETTYQCRR